MWKSFNDVCSTQNDSFSLHPSHAIENSGWRATCQLSDSTMSSAKTSTLVASMLLFIPARMFSSLSTRSQKPSTTFQTWIQPIARAWPLFSSQCFCYSCGSISIISAPLEIDEFYNFKFLGNANQSSALGESLFVFVVVRVHFNNQLE